MPEGNQEDLVRKVSVAQAMLDRVIHTTDNLDEKVGRIFASMSFVIVGATILFTSFITDKRTFVVGGVDLVSVLFVLFIIAVAFATAFMLQAMGPRIRFGLRSGQQPSMVPGGPSSTGYADKIARLQEKEWTDYLKEVPLGDLYQKLFDESVKEVFELSKKVERKVGEMRMAQRAFLLAILFLILIIILGVSPYL